MVKLEKNWDHLEETVFSRITIEKNGITIERIVFHKLLFLGA